jgi:hypothetical protein
MVGAVHARLMDVDDCPTLLGVTGAPGAVDCDITALRAPSPTELTPLTAKLYLRPADKLPISSLVLVAAYDPTSVETVDPAVPSSRYTLYDVTAAPPDSTDAVQVTLMPVAV